MIIYLVGEINGRRRIIIKPISMYKNVATRVHCSDMMLSYRVFVSMFIDVFSQILVSKLNFIIKL